MLLLAHHCHYAIGGSIAMNVQRRPGHGNKIRIQLLQLAHFEGPSSATNYFLFVQFTEKNSKVFCVKFTELFQ